MKDYKNNILSLKNMLKNITIDKWLLLGGAGIMLILCSDSCNSKKNLEDTEATTYNTTLSENLDSKQYVDYLENKLEAIISKIEGVGDVQVMVTVKNTSTKEVLKEQDKSEKELNEADSSGGSRESFEQSIDENIIYDEKNSSEKSPFVISNYMPEVEGVAVIAKGGDSPLVKEKITGIIKALFGIEINKIAVGKMK